MASSTPVSADALSQIFQTRFEDICREVQSSVISDVIAPWTDEDGTASDSCVHGPYVEGGMPESLAVHLRDNLGNFSAFDGGDFQDWNVARPQPQWMEHFFGQQWKEHFFGQQWKDQGIYPLIKLFDRPLVMDRSLLSAALCFWSSATNTLNLRFGMMTPTVLDMAALFGLSPLGVEVNAALVAPEAAGSFKAAWPTVAKLAGGKAKNMLNYSSFYSNFGVEDSPDDDSIAPLGEVEHAAFLLYWLCKFVFCTQANKVTLEFAHLADHLAQGGRLALGPFLLGHIYRTLRDVVTDGMKPKHGGPLWAFQFWLQAYFPELRAAVNPADTEPLANALARAPRKHNTSVLCYKFFYELTERTGAQFRVCLTRPFPLFLTHDLSIIPDGETENDLREIWGSFLVARDLHCGMSKAGAEVYLPYFVARQFGLIQTAPLPPVWYEECISARFIRPAEEAARGALKNADWDPLLPKAGKAKKASVAPPRPTMTAVSGPRVAASPSARPAAAASSATPTPRASVTAGARKTLAQRTVLSTSPARPVAAAALGRKRGREAAGAGTAVIGAAPARDAVAEMVPVQRPRKRALLILSEGEDEGDVPTEIVAEAPDAEEGPAAEETVQETVDGEDTAERQAEEEAEEEEEAEDEETEEDVEMLEAETGRVARETVVELLDSEVPTEEQAQTAPVAIPAAAIAVPTSAATALASPSPSIPRRPGGIRIGSVSAAAFLVYISFFPPRSSVPLSQDSVVVTALPVVESANMDAPSPLPVSSGVLTELVAVGGSGISSAVEEAVSPDDLEFLFASLHEEGGCSALAPLDEDYKAVLERLREFLLCDAYHMTTAEAFIEFRACLDEAMAMGLLDSAQLDELQLRLAEGEEMLGRCAEASRRMTEGCLLEQELAAIKEQVQPIMARLKENDLAVRKENEELAQVEA
ncbi:unnamed protein product [Prunus brigantina]